MPRSGIRPRTAAEIRDLDRRAIQEFGIPGIVLMENAGRGAAEIAVRLAGEPPGSVVCACGRGNNGGDGFVVARHLANRGYRVETFLTAPPDAVNDPPDAATNLRICRMMRIPVAPLLGDADFREFEGRLAGASLIVDALLGTGLGGPVKAPYDRAIEAIDRAHRPVLAIDIPSGLDADTGEVHGVAVHATVTATFGAPKVGFDRGEGPLHTGRVDLIEISIPRALFPELA